MEAGAAGVTANREGIFFSQQMALFFMAASWRTVSGGGVADRSGRRLVSWQDSAVISDSPSKIFLFI
jgi:hypothetical protein